MQSPRCRKCCAESFLRDRCLCRGPLPGWPPRRRVFVSLPWRGDGRLPFRHGVRIRCTVAACGAAERSVCRNGACAAQRRETFFNVAHGVRGVSVCAAGSGPRFAGRSGRVPPCGRPGGGEFPFGPRLAAVPRSEAAGLGFSGIIRNFTLAKAKCGL